MRCTTLSACIASALLLLAGCSSSGGGTVITVLGYSVTIKTAPPTTAQVGASVPIAFTVTENESDGSSKPASGKSFTVTVTAGGGTIGGATSATLTTGADGSASLTWVLGSAVGTQTLRGSVSADKFLDVNVTATAPSVSSVVVTLATPSIALGTVGDQATAVIKDASGNVLQGRTVTWQSSSATVATVSATGVVTTVGVGTSTITATSEGQSGGALLTVTPVPVATVTATLAAATITLGTVGDQATAVTKDASGNVLQGRTVTWQSSSTTVATVSATGVITTVGVGTSTITATSEGQNGTVLLTVTQSTWNAAWTLRKQITVTTTTAAPAGYSVAVQLDHASLVGGGKALATGNDVRVLYWTGSTWVELDRALDAGSAWNSATTKIWFSTQAPIPASGADNNYYIYYHNAAAGPPPANRSNVFLFSDDFEAGNLNKWTQLLGLWTVDNTRSHSGTFALMYPVEGDVDGLTRMLVANPALNVADVYVESWWYLNSASTSYNLAQGLRMTGVQPTSNGYYTKLYNNSPFGWVNGKVIGGTFFQLSAAPVGPLFSNSWIRVGTGMVGTTMTTFVNGAGIGSVSGLTELTSGNIAFRKFFVPNFSAWWVDDVIARRYVTPEPTAATGGEQAAP